MFRYRVWVIAGDEYELTSYRGDTPCRKGYGGGELVTLADLKAEGFKGDFDLSLGGGSWERVSLTDRQCVHGGLRLECEGGLEDAKVEDLVEIVSAALNTPETKAKLEALGLKSPRIFSHLRD